MEVRVRDVCIRGKKEYIIEADGLAKERQLKLLLESIYNSIITDPEFIKQISRSKEKKAISDIKKLIEKYLKETDVKIF